MRVPGEDCPCLHSRAPVYLASGAVRGDSPRLQQCCATGGSVELGPALAHFASFQVLCLRLRFEMHDSDMSRLSLRMAPRSSPISSEGRSCGVVN